MEKPAPELPQHDPAVSLAALERPSWKRRIAGVVAAGLLAWYGLTRLQPCGTVRDPVEQVLSLQPLTDGHNDFPFFLRAFYGDRIYQSNFSDQISLPFQVDFPRLAQGRLRGQFWSVYIGCNETHPEPDYVYVHDTLQQIDLVHRLAERYPEHLEIVPDSTAFRRTFETSPSKIASFLGVEGLHQIGSSPATLRLYHSLGVRYTTLTHVCHNEYADSATPTTPRHNGLSTAGRKIVHEMNRLGMAVDLAHVSAKTMHDALDISKAPVIFSHSSAYALCPHPRNVPDNVLHRLAENGGIIMITFFPEYTRCDDPASATLSDVADHIQYVGELIGYQYVGLGSDFDGMATAITGLEDVSKYPDLIKELLSRGVSVEDVAGVIGGNILRVMGDIENVSKQMIEDGITPLEDAEVRAAFF
ncbi:membrane dipeptidase-domain-containing protein [Aspergillus granulosus]|uniref:Dipeptidase n=1 Tax=Aspergillus granulosus TaxID=176169 RepID=A0ABR4GWK8_9EURO